MGAGHMVGRERELALLLEGLAGLSSGRGRLFLLTGEPGIGKTRLADELCARATSRGAQCAWGAAWDGGGAPAYWPWIQALRAMRGRFGEPDARLRRDLGPLWDDGGGDRDEEGGDPEMLRFRRFDALRALLSSASQKAPLVLVLDDLHAADRGSLLALQFLARALRDVPVLIIGTHRDAPARLDPALGELLGRVAREGTPIALGSLTEAHVAERMSELDHVTPELTARVYEASGGNPLLLEEIVRWVRMGGDAREVPDGARAIIDERVRLLAPDTHTALDALAVLGREASLDTLAFTANLDLATLRARLHDATLAGIVTVSSTHARFSHALFRESLYARLEHRHRQALHRTAAAAWARGPAGANLESVALHRVASLERASAERTAEVCVSAARRAARALAFDRAVTLFEGALQALDLLPPDPVRRVDVMLGLADALGRSGALERGGAVCLAAAEAARALGDGARLCAAALAYGAQFRIAVVDPVLVGLLQEGLAAIGATDRTLAARVMARLAAAEQPAPDPQRPIARAREAIALAREVGDPDTLLATLFTAGSAFVDYAPPSERLRLNHEIVALALPRNELVMAQHAYVRLTVDCLELGDVAGADDAIAANERLGQALGHARWRWRGPLLRSMRALMDGRWADSEAAIAEAQRFAQLGEDASAAAGIAIHRIGALAARETASVAEVDALWIPAIDRLGFSSTWLPPLRAATAARLGELGPARRSTFPMPPGSESLLEDPLYLSVMCELLPHRDDPAHAEQILGHVRSHAAEYLTWGVMGLVWAGPRARMVGAALRALGRWDEAAAALEDAVASLDALGARPLGARARLELGMALRARGGERDLGRARELLDEAEGIATALQMRHLLERIREQRATIGAATATPEPIDRPVSMTREGEVWSIRYGDQLAHVRHSRAFDILAQLVAHPGREFHALDLATGGDPGDVIDLGDAGEALDDRAKASYRQRLAELDEELAEATEWADSARRERLQAQAEFLREELARAVGAGGRDRRVARAAERARVNVQKRVRGAIQRVGETLPALARHLQSHVTTGLYVSYRP